MAIYQGRNPSRRDLLGCTLPEQPVECLLGRDVLARWTLTCDGRTGLWKIEEEDFPVSIIQPEA